MRWHALLLRAALVFAAGGVLLPTLGASAATITVTGAGDSIAVDGAVTLREAMTSTNTGANVNADVAAVGAYGVNDQILFSIPGAGVHTIAPGSALPTITQPVTIDGYTQPGSSPNTLVTGDNAVLRIDLTGINHGGSGVGLLIQTSNATVRGLTIHFFNVPIQIMGSSNRVIGNFIGVDPTGSSAGGPNTSRVVYLINNSSNNTIGGTAPADRNIISGGGVDGVNIAGSSNGNIVQGNYIGTNAAGTAAIPNGFGVALGVGCSNNLIGGTAAGAGNLISGNLYIGVSIPLLSNTSNVVQGNLIGTDVTGLAPLGNGTPGITSAGVLVQGTSNTIGGTAAGAANVIAFNKGPGVDVLSATGSAIRGNSIFSNTGLGIDLAENGVTPNDTCDADLGPNGFQNFPVLTTGIPGAGSTTILGRLNSTASASYQLDFYASAVCDPSGHGEGQTYLGSTMVMTDASCNATFSATLPVAVGPRDRLTATATDSNGNTSEFCGCLSLQALYYTISPCRVADTRGAAGPYGAPALNANAERSFVITGRCGIPPTAQAVVFNFTITQPDALGDLRIFPGGSDVPLVSAINYRPGQTRANNAIVPLGPSGEITVHVDQSSGTVQVIVDVYGYLE